VPEDGISGKTGPFSLERVVRNEIPGESFPCFGAGGEHGVRHFRGGPTSGVAALCAVARGEAAAGKTPGRFQTAEGERGTHNHVYRLQ
jgi:hypothetical protein